MLYRIGRDVKRVLVDHLKNSEPSSVNSLCLFLITRRIFKMSRCAARLVEKMHHYTVLVDLPCSLSQGDLKECNCIFFSLEITVLYCRHLNTRSLRIRLTVGPGILPICLYCGSLSPAISVPRTSLSSRSELSSCIVSGKKSAIRYPAPAYLL